MDAGIAHTLLDGHKDDDVAQHSDEVLLPGETTDHEVRHVVDFASHGEKLPDHDCKTHDCLIHRYFFHSQ